MGAEWILKFKSFYKNTTEAENEIFKQQFGINFKESIDRDTIDNRILKIATHEILHMFSMDHCIYYDCNLCGVNGLYELDNISFSLCPICISKLYIVNRFDVKKRQCEMVKFYENKKLDSEVKKNEL